MHQNVDISEKICTKVQYFRVIACVLFSLTKTV